MFRKITAALGGLIVGCGIALTVGAPAQAQTQVVTATAVYGQHCGAYITWTNSTEWHFWGDYQFRGQDEGILDEALPPLPADPADYGDAHNHGVTPNQIIASGPLKGLKFGYQYNPVHLPPGETVEIFVSPTGEAETLRFGVMRGAENDLYLPFLPQTKELRLLGVKPCAKPVVEFEDLCQAVKVNLANKAKAKTDAKFKLHPVLEGVGLIVELAPGHGPEALLFPADEKIIIVEITTGQEWEWEWSEPEECATPAPTPEPTPTMSPEPSPEPTEAPGEGGDDNLPVTSGLTALKALGGSSVALAGLGGLFYLLGRRRPVSFRA